MALGPDIQQQVYDLLSRASNISFVSTDQEAAPRIALTPGQRVSAEVLSTLPNNRTQVRIGSERFNLDLPMAVRPGQTLEMTFVSEDPRSTFAIARQGGLTPPVSLSDASRLLSLLVSTEQLADPKLRSSLQSIGDILRRSSGESGVLANLMDEALTYGSVLRDGVKGPGEAPGDQRDQFHDPQGGRQLSQEQARLSSFEANAGQILRNIAQSSRFILVEAANQPVLPLPLIPGNEVDAVVLASLPGGKVFVQVAGSSLELMLPRAVQNGELLRLTVIATQPKLLFAIPRIQPEPAPGELSEAGRWLSVLEHSEGGVSQQQMYVLERLNTVLKSLPPDSPAFTAILEEAITYDTIMRGRNSPEQDAQAQAQAVAAAMARQGQLLPGNGIVLSDDMAKLLQAVIKGHRLALLEALNQQSQPTGLMPGQQLKGEVLAALGGGRFLVQVAGQALEFSMPRGTKRGDLATLFFISEEPRPTFLMARFGRPGDSKLSETGRWLSGFLEGGGSRLSTGETLGLLRTLLGAPPEDASSLSRSLQRGLQESGLFYEAHLARWFGGEYALEQLLREPQGRLSPRLQTALPALASGERPGEEAAPAALKSGGAHVLETALRAGTDSLSHEGLADRRTLALVNEQLSALQNGQILFRGELFPGQSMQWSVAERDAHRSRSGERESAWETALALDLPGLGPVHARLSLNGTRLSVAITAEKSKTVAVMASARERLAEQLQAAGFEATEIGIGEHETK